VKRLEGEELAWFRVASHLGRTVQEAQATLTSTEFLKWVWFLDWKATKEFRREDYYMANIAACVERGHVKKPKAVTLEKMLLKFSSKKELETAENKLQKSKSFWMGFAGLIGKKDKAKKRPLPRKVKMKGNK